MTNRKMMRVLLAMVLVLLMGTVACVRTLPEGQVNDEKGLATDAAAETKDAAVQMTLEALLGTATNQVEEDAPTATPEPTEVVPTDTPEPTAEATTDEAGDATATSAATAEATATAASTVALGDVCYQSRFVYDETYSDGTRVDPGEEIVKTWRLQNTGSCDWVNGKYRLAFVSGSQMGGKNPTLIEFTVLSGAYANFSIDLTVPETPGTYTGYWMLESTDGDPIGWGDDSKGTVYIEIQVRGDTPTPKP